MEVEQPAAVQAQKIDHATWSSHYDLRASLDRIDLVFHPDASIAAQAAQAKRLGKLANFVVDLDGKLSCRGKEERDGPVPWSEWGLIKDVAKHGQDKRESLAAPSLGHANDVAARHDRGKCLPLNGKWLEPPAPLEHVHHPLAQAGLAPLCNGLGKRLHAPHLDFKRCANLFDLLFRQIGHRRGLDIKVLAEINVLNLGMVHRLKLLLPKLFAQEFNCRSATGFRGQYCIMASVIFQNDA
mmetsp:Transcript_11466/g.36733  ORF Transcript_11466/g.36733 Transcript_11466/m.36733 type:complete len:240 (+) Transcript_11466:1213-1932(+)